MSLADKFFEHEDELIRRFHEHSFFRNFREMSNQELQNYLKQNWFLSNQFVQWYDRAINNMEDEEGKKVLREIVSDETPHDAPSHREDLMADLAYIGVSKSELMFTKPTKETTKAGKKLHTLVDYEETSHYDMQTLVRLRVAGEILVAEGYRHVVPALESRFGLAPKDSRFYAPHFFHDRKDSETGDHTHSFEKVLNRMINTKEKLEVAIDSSERAYEARILFYDQFTTEHRDTIMLKRSGWGTAALLAASIGISLLLPTPEISLDKQDWNIPNEITGTSHYTKTE